MTISSKDIISLTKAREKLTELCEQVHREHGEKIITKNGASCVALIDAGLLDYYHQLEREHIHIILLEEAALGIKDADAGKALSLKSLKSRYGR